MKMTVSGGIIPVYKPSGMSSSAVTAKIKRFLGIKAGHFGTLDPMASGVLPVMVGRATRLSEYLSENKEYNAVLKLGIKTETGDVTGKIIETAKIPALTEEKIEAAISTFKGEIMQTPPIYSALSVGGKKLYKYALSGESVEIKARPVKIYGIKLNFYNEDEIGITVSCGKGTYIRTLCEDIAKKLETVGTMKQLERSLSGGFAVSETVKLDDFLACDNPSDYIVSPEKIASNFNKVFLDKTAVTYYKNGGEINKERVEGLKKGIASVYYKDEFLGIGEGLLKENGELSLKGLWQNPKDEEV